MKEYVNENLQDLEKKGIDTQPLKDLFNQALTLLPDNLVNKNSIDKHLVLINGPG